MQRDAIAIKAEDNVATAIRDLEIGHEAVVGLGEEILRIKLSQTVEFGHKLATRDIRRGLDVLKYAAVIGRATQDISKGQHVHVHNVESLRGRGDLQQNPCGCGEQAGKGCRK